MKSTPLSSIFAIALFYPMVATAQQEPIEILLDDTTLGGSVTAGETVTAGGVTMTVTDVLGSAGGRRADVGDFGIIFGTATDVDDLASMGISFNVDVRIVDYVIGAREDVLDGTHFTVTGTEDASGPNPVPPFVGATEQEVTRSYVPGSLPVLKAGQTYTITHNLFDVAGPSDDPFFFLESLLVTPVDLSIQSLPDLIRIEYVGTLQQWSPGEGWQDMNPRPPNIWQFAPDSASQLFRARAGNGAISPEEPNFAADSGDFDSMKTGTFGAFVNGTLETSITINQVRHVDLVWNGETLKTSRVEISKDGALVELGWDARAADGSIYNIQREVFEEGFAPFEGLVTYDPPLLWYPGTPVAGQNWTNFVNGETHQMEVIDLDATSPGGLAGCVVIRETKPGNWREDQYFKDGEFVGNIRTDLAGNDPDESLYRTGD